MTTATIGVPATAAALDNKKRFAQALDARETARSALDAVKAAPRAARAGLASVLRALHLDSVAGALSGWARSGWAALVSRYEWLSGHIGRIFGWKLLGFYTLVDKDSRNTAGRLVGNAYLFASLAVMKAGSWLRKVPFIGAPLVSLVGKPLAFVDRQVIKSAALATTQIAKVEDHWAVDLLAAGAKVTLILRGIRALVPAPWRLPLYLGLALRTAVPWLKRLLEEFSRDDESLEAWAQMDRAKNTAKAAMAHAGDVVVDRIMDGPKPPRVHTTAPGTDQMEIIEVASGKRHTVTVEIDGRGERWIHWDGITYSVSELPDEIAPIPVDALTAAVREANAKAEAVKAAENGAAAPVSGVTPPPEIVLPRPVSRTLVAKAKAPAKPPKRR